MNKKTVELQRLVFMLSQDMSAEKELEEMYGARKLNVYRLGFPIRIANALSYCGYKTLEDLYKIDCYEQLKRIRNIGVGYQAKLIACMRELGLTGWADRVESTKPQNQEEQTNDRGNI